MRHFFRASTVALPRGVGTPNERIRVRPYGRATFRAGEIVELDQAKSLTQTTTMDVGASSSGYYNARLPTSDGAKHGRVHVIIVDDVVPQGRECWALVAGLVNVNGSGDYGIPAVVSVEGDSDLHGRRVKGIIVGAGDATGKVLVMWDGQSGFGTLQTPGGGGGGGGSDGEGSDVSDGSGGSDGSDGSDGSGGGGDVDDDVGSEIGGVVAQE